MSGMPAAKMNDQIVAMDTHIVMVPSPGGPVPTPTPGHPFNGVINGNLSNNVMISGMPAATVDSTAQNMPPHIPIGGPSFQIPPSNQARIVQGSLTVMVNGRGVARNGDPALTCDDLVLAPQGQVVAAGTVLVG
ncbi:MAG: hypothetical protein GXY52_07155 [Chloroflexi bacterium]|nr:hypothetical protein [Chloroflexota bacterium]